MKITHEEVVSTFDREHVTPYIRNHKQFSKAGMSNPEDLSYLRWTVDEPEDLQVVTKVFESFSPNILFSWQQVLELQ